MTFEPGGGGGGGGRISKFDIRNPILTFEIGGKNSILTFEILSTPFWIAFRTGDDFFYQTFIFNFMTVT